MRLWMVFVRESHVRFLVHVHVPVLHVHALVRVVVHALGDPVHAPALDRVHVRDLVHAHVHAKYLHFKSKTNFLEQIFHIFY